jgi:hypothetical protein
MARKQGSEHCAVMQTEKRIWTASDEIQADSSSAALIPGPPEQMSTGKLVVYPSTGHANCINIKSIWILGHWCQRLRRTLVHRGAVRLGPHALSFEQVGGTGGGVDGQR